MSAVRAVAALFLYAAAVFALAPLLALAIHQGAAAAGVATGPLHELTADCLKLVALLGLIPLMRLQGYRGAAAWGLVCARPAPALLAGAAFGAVTMGALLAVLLALGVRELRADLTAPLLAAALAKAALTATLVSVIEELWFRGAVTRVTLPLGPARSVALVALLYALVHFIRPDRVVPAPEYWTDGYVALFGMFGRFTQPANGDAFVALLAAGIALGWLRQRQGCIAGAVGCHAAWVFLLQFARRTTEVPAPADWHWLSGGYDGVIGWGFVAVLAVAGTACLGRRSSREG